MLLFMVLSSQALTISRGISSGPPLFTTPRVIFFFFFPFGRDEVSWISACTY